MRGAAAAAAAAAAATAACSKRQRPSAAWRGDCDGPEAASPPRGAALQEAARLPRGAALASRARAPSRRRRPRLVDSTLPPWFDLGAPLSNPRLVCESSDCFVQTSCSRAACSRSGRRRSARARARARARGLGLLCAAPVALTPRGVEALHTQAAESKCNSKLDTKAWAAPQHTARAHYTQGAVPATSHPPPHTHTHITHFAPLCVVPPLRPHCAALIPVGMHTPHNTHNRNAPLARVLLRPAPTSRAMCRSRPLWPAQSGPRKVSCFACVCHVFFSVCYAS